MQTNTLLPDAKHLRLDDIRSDGSRVVVAVRSAAPTSNCPKCGKPGNRVHSHYQRQLQDLPWQGVAICIHWRSRRFFCDNGRCPQRIFTERLPELTAPHCRMTQRLVTTLRALALACGGEVGARLAQRLAMPTSPNTLLREIRRTHRESDLRVRVLGVDDWALRRGQRYGTILVDLETHHTIDLLPDRSSEAFAAWLAQHPEVEIIARDRGEHYTKGATTGAPQAIQVADRWHLMHNLHQALTRVIERFPRALNDAARQAVAAQAATSEVSPQLPAQPAIDKALQSATSSQSEHGLWPRQPRWQEKYDRLVELQRQKLSVRAIARELGLDRSTVSRWIKAGCLPSLPRRGGGRRSQLGKWHAYLKTRWQAGCHNAVTLTAELQAQGYTGSYCPVRRLVAAWRRHDATDAGIPTTAPRSPSAKSVAWWLVNPPDERDSDHRRFVELFCAACPVAAQAASLANEFNKLVRDRDLDHLDEWLERAATQDSPIEMRRFAKGLREDLAAVQSALSLPWSNGQTEGQVNRVKLIKRQMFGRAKFDLLRQRVLAQPA